MIPKKVTIKVYQNILINELFDEISLESFERNRFTDDEIKNEIEKIIRYNIWQYIPENKINIEFD